MGLLLWHDTRAALATIHKVAFYLLSNRVNALGKFTMMSQIWDCTVLIFCLSGVQIVPSVLGGLVEGAGDHNDQHLPWSQGSAHISYAHI